MSEAIGQVIVDVVTEIAKLEGCDPTELTPPLGACVDTDALISLMERSDTPVRVTFDYLEYEVTLLAESNGPDVFVRRRS